MVPSGIGVVVVSENVQQLAGGIEALGVGGIQGGQDLAKPAGDYIVFFIVVHHGSWVVKFYILVFSF